ncbi:GAF domain-containing protein [Kineococcus xinjiangensis]|uniref:GAF domain-containing protein n=1 Tax=Kineococcus xinjiangensis TaxID=512762 RepID=A0A2S6IEE4_9ACTN|nr:GAF and ANTAR domain-containing protein [Kineococcus xinjiangensis]PPK92588.1 GAF domain-containing protein [Kineococcus xinjiangensis]
MSIAARFTDAWTGIDDPLLAAGDLLPVRLARACVQVLGVDGAGLSVMDGPGLRVPVGASDERAAAAERSQFTVGEGPCLHAHATGSTVLATDDVIAQRWPALYEQVVQGAGVRAVASLPLRAGRVGFGALDVYYGDPGDLGRLDLAAAGTVVTSIVRVLTASPGAADDPEGPSWLGSPGARRRGQVWQAMGVLNVRLGLGAPDALALLRAHAYATERDVDGVARDLLHGRLPLADLRLGPRA